MRNKQYFLVLNYILYDYFFLELSVQCSLLASFGNGNLISCYYLEIYPKRYISTLYSLSSKYALVSGESVKLYSFAVLNLFSDIQKTQFLKLIFV